MVVEIKKPVTITILVTGYIFLTPNIYAGLKCCAYYRQQGSPFIRVYTLASLYIFLNKNIYLGYTPFLFLGAYTGLNHPIKKCLTDTPCPTTIYRKRIPIIGYPFIISLSFLPSQTLLLQYLPLAVAHGSLRF